MPPPPPHTYTHREESHCNKSGRHDVVTSSKIVYFVSHVIKHNMQFNLAKAYITLSRCSAYETHNKLLGKIFSSIIYSKNKLGCAVHYKQ